MTHLLLKQGEQIGELGFSGDAFLAHLHYELQSDANGEGLPSYFRDYKRVIGDRAITVKRGQIDSGNVLLGSRPR